jgi:hypothetical protein
VKEVTGHPFDWMSLPLSAALLPPLLRYGGIAAAALTWVPRVALCGRSAP